MLEAMSMYPCWLFVSQKTDQNISAISYMSFFGSGKGFFFVVFYLCYIGGTENFHGSDREQELLKYYMIENRSTPEGGIYAYI